MVGKSYVVREVPRLPCDNTDLAQVVIVKGSTAGLAPSQTLVQRPGRPCESQNWHMDNGLSPLFPFLTAIKLMGDFPNLGDFPIIPWYLRC